MGQNQTQKLNIQQAQSLTLTKDLQQAIKLLQLSQIELASYIEAELLQNPLLELSEETQDPEEIKDKDETQEDLNPLDFDDSMSQEKSMDTDYENLWDPNLSMQTQRSSGASASEFDLIQNYAEEENLKDYLLKQLSCNAKDEIQKKIGFYIIDHLDVHGYLHQDIDVLAQDLKVDASIVLEALHLIQNMDPPGIAARNLKECLSLQLKDQGLLNQDSLNLLEHLDWIGQKNVKILQVKTGLSHKVLIDWIEIIQSLNPYPASAFGSVMQHNIIPDLYLIPQANGEYKVELNQENMPKIGLNKVYYQDLKKYVSKGEDKNYVQNAYQNASWLLKAIEQRGVTLKKVAEQIVKHQIAFFKYGISALKPLILKEIAEATHLHESTISRVTTNKYMATPNGVFELKFFFTTSLQNAFGESEISSEFVRQRLKDHISGEIYPDIISDDALVHLLHKEGITIARRTIAKYREAMHIPSSILRRQQKRPLE